MKFCSKCGAKVPEDAYFCPKCGSRTRKGIEAGIPAPVEDIREAFIKMGKELEKAFTTAAKEVEKTFRTAGENIKEASSTELIACPRCMEKNPSGASFCYKCGEKI